MKNNLPFVMLHNLIIPLLIAFYFGYLSIYIFTLIPVTCGGYHPLGNMKNIIIILISFPVGVISTRYRDFYSVKNIQWDA